MRTKKVAIYVLLIGLAVAGVLFFCINHGISFEPVATLDWDRSKCTNSITDELKWFTILDDAYNPWFDESIFKEFQADLSDIRFDKDNYSYVVTINRELKKLSYNYLAFSGSINRYHGRVTLGKETPGKLYIYRIKKMNITIDIHDWNSNTNFE